MGDYSLCAGPPSCLSSGEAESGSDEDLAAWIEKSRTAIAPENDEEETEQTERVTSKGVVATDKDVYLTMSVVARG